MSRQEKTIITLSSLVILFAIGTYFLLPKLLLSLTPKNRNFIGILVKGEGDLKMRFGDSINWNDIKKRDKIYSQTYLFTGDNSSALYAFLDESSISLGPNSLIFLDFITEKETSASNDPLGIDLVDGEIKFDLKEKSPVKQIKVNNAIIDISDKQTTIKLSYKEDQGMDISVLAGQIDIVQKNKNYKVDQGERVGIARNHPVIKKSVVDADTMAEIQKIAELERKQIIEELNKRREFSNLFREIFNLIKSNFF